MSPRFEADDVRRYYDRHTPAFLRLGRGGAGGSIHRAVWGPGVSSRAGAFHYVDDLVASRARALLAERPAPLHLVDLGCGVAASLCYLAERVPIIGTGVTLSPVQVRLAAQRIRDAGLSDRVRCIEGDFTALPSDIGQADLAYAVESFVHGPSPQRFFAESARILRPGGVLMLCDDVRRDATGDEAEAVIDRFCRGWQVNSLLRREDLRILAEGAGFVVESVTDLTPWLELRRPRDRALEVVAAAADWGGRVHRSMTGRPPEARGRLSARFGHLLGGSALQTCLARGWIGYDVAVFRRT